jgi:hypothetical protein
VCVFSFAFLVPRVQSGYYEAQYEGSYFDNPGTYEVVVCVLPRSPDAQPEKLEFSVDVMAPV